MTASTDFQETRKQILTFFYFYKKLRRRKLPHQLNNNHSSLYDIIKVPGIIQNQISKMY